MIKQKICVFEQNMVRHFTVATMSQLPMQQCHNCLCNSKMLTQHCCMSWGFFRYRLCYIHIGTNSNWFQLQKAVALAKYKLQITI